MNTQPYEPLAKQVEALTRTTELDLALAMMNQARIRSSPITADQVIHLLSIGFRAGYDTGRKVGEA